jgi:hypothetical protein
VHILKLAATTALAALALTASALSSAQPAAAATAKNYSIFLGTPGTEVFGTLANGVFKQKSSVSTSKAWYLAAVSRTTLLLYKRTSGATQTGTFTNGVYVKKHSYTLPTGFDLATASCDTAMLYRHSDGKTITATLSGGALGKRHATILQSDLPLQFLAASCDSYVGGYQKTDTLTQLEAGTLSGGRQSPTDSLAEGNQRISLLTATASSFLVYGPDGSGGGTAAFGTLKQGLIGSTNHLSGFSAWDKIGGTADSVLFYRSAAGLEARVTLKQGVYANKGSGTDFSAGWKVIAGGK